MTEGDVIECSRKLSNYHISVVNHQSAVLKIYTVQPKNEFFKMCSDPTDKPTCAMGSCLENNTSFSICNAQHTSNHLWSATQSNALPAGIRAATKRDCSYSNRYITQHAVVWKPRAKLGTINSPPSNKKKKGKKQITHVLHNTKSNKIYIEFRTRSTFQVHKVLVAVYIHYTEIKCITNRTNWFHEFFFFFSPYFVHLFILLGD